MLPSITVPGLEVSISTYALIRTLYLFIALPLVVWMNERQQISPRITFTAFAFGVPAGIVGAHLLDMAEYWDRYGSLRQILSREGSSIYGAFLVVFPLLWLYSRWEGVSALRLLDGGAPAMALGEAMTRIGCFMNGCCYGVPWNGPWAVTFPRGSFAYADQMGRALLPPDARHSLAVHPVQLYSAIIMAVVFVGLVRMALRPHRDGSLFFAFLISYGVLRLGMAPLRQEALASMKLFSVLFIAGGTLGLLARTRLKAHRLAPSRLRTP